MKIAVIGGDGQLGKDVVAGEGVPVNGLGARNLAVVAQSFVVDNEIVTRTSTTELAAQLVQLSRSDCYGLYHATAEGGCSWHEFAQESFALTDTPVRLKVAEAGKFPAKVPRPKYSVLENPALKSRGLNLFKPGQEGLKLYLEKRISSGNA